MLNVDPLRTLKEPIRNSQGFSIQAYNSGSQFLGSAIHHLVHFLLLSATLSHLLRPRYVRNLKLPANMAVQLVAMPQLAEVSLVDSYLAS